jgi:rfaE bifunctional protein kinase chain/domain
MSELKFEGRKIIVIGDVMIDRYLEGNVSGISPEADVPVFRKQAVSNYLGGAANVAVNISNLGAKSILVGLRGDDESGKELKTLLDENPNIIDYTITSPRITTVKTRIISDNKHLIRIDSEDDRVISESVESQLLQKIQQAINEQSPEGVIFQDYNKGLLTPHVITETISICRKSGIKTFVDPKFYNIEAYRHATLFKPNKKELEYLIQEQLSIEEMKSGELLMSLRQRMDCQILVVTVGGDGIIYVDDRGIHHCKAIYRNIVDVCGAGDTVISILATALCSEVSTDHAVSLANIGGGQVCGLSGVKAVNYTELTKEYTGNH